MEAGELVGEQTGGGVAMEETEVESPTEPNETVAVPMEEAVELKETEVLMEPERFVPKPTVERIYHTIKKTRNRLRSSWVYTEE